MQARYTLQWQASHSLLAAAARAFGKPPAAASSLRLRQRRSRVRDTAHNAALAAAAQALQRLQLHAAGPGDKAGSRSESLQLVTASTGGSSAAVVSAFGSDTQAAAAAVALFRVAASETQVRAAFQQLVVDAASAPLDRYQAATALQSADAYGATQKAGAVLLPRLLPAADSPPPDSSTFGSSGGSGVGSSRIEAQPASWRQVAVSGGLGGLGLLAALWLAWQGARSLLLLSRSGRWAVQYQDM